jgi:hypothetical protein
MFHLAVFGLGMKLLGAKVASLVQGRGHAGLFGSAGLSASGIGTTSQANGLD